MTRMKPYRSKVGPLPEDALDEEVLFDPKPLLAASIVAGVKALATPADDSKILSLFREWVEAKRLSWAVPDDEYEAAAEAADKIEDAIIATPSSGAAGFAIKTYLLLHIDDGHDEDAAALGKLNWPALGASLLRDMIRFVPELAPLAAGAFVDSQPDEQP
jgi:hypothetical protein